VNVLKDGGGKAKVNVSYLKAPSHEVCGLSLEKIEKVEDVKAKGREHHLRDP